MFKKLKNLFSLEGHEGESRGHFLARMGLYLIVECTEQLIILIAVLILVLFVIANFN